ncbi:MAG: PQQ-binding-like beta-propeller repeat protein [FCB group bacterium]|nr:PQQ-binding-like beta-propeller repeat protein [FCB group bacterium]
MTTAIVKRVFGGIVTLGVALSALAQAADWPQINGPNRDATSTEKGLLRSWPEAGPKVLWTTAVGGGYAGPTVRDGEVYFLDRVENQKDILRCLDLDTGEEQWRYEYDAPGKVGHTGSRNPATIDEKYVYSVGLMGDFLCVDRKTHQPVWQKNFMKDFGAELPQWGFSQAPLLYKNLVIVVPQAADALVAAYDRVSGELVWKTPGFGRPGYVSPVVSTIDGVEQVLMIAASDKAGTTPGGTVGISVEDGSILWKYEGWQCFIPIAYPMALPGNRVFVTAGYKSGSAMIEVKKGEKGWDVKELYKLGFEVCGSHLHQPLLYKDYLYVNSNSNERDDGLVCLALDGTVKWNTGAVEGQPNFERGSLILADDMIIALDGKTGILYLVDPSPDGYKQLAQAKVIEGREMWAPLALSDGKLIVRSQDTMKCLDIKTP